MMMLVVFTAFPGMECKSAVGTSHDVCLPRLANGVCMLRCIRRSGVSDSTLRRTLEGYSTLFNQRHPCKAKTSLLLLFCKHAALIALCWGWLDKAYIAVPAILMWGVGDTAAALIGKRYRKHRIHLPLADPHKTWEGSLAMVPNVFIAGFVALLIIVSLDRPSA